jgi:hypothetical protein
MNFFNDVVTDMDKIEQEFLGPDYAYYKFINNPSALGMSGDGSMKALRNDVEGIVDYVQLLISGRGPGSKTGQPLGDRFFLKTGGQCKDYKTGKLVNRDMYINNVPDGNIPLLSEVSGMQFTEFEGLIPGIFSNLDALNPLTLFSAFMEGENPLCAEVSLETIDSNNNRSRKSGFIPISELKTLENKGDIPRNTVSKAMMNSLQNEVNGKEGFINLGDLKHNVMSFIEKKQKYKTDSVTNAYIIGVALLFLYIAYRAMKK